MSEELRGKYEFKRINWRAKNYHKDLLNPLYRILESSKMLWLISGMENKLHEAKSRNPTGNYEDAESKLNALIEISEYHFWLWELATQTNLQALNADRISIQLKYENEELKKQIAVLNKEKEF